VWPKTRGTSYQHLRRRVVSSPRKPPPHRFLAIVVHRDIRYGAMSQALAAEVKDALSPLRQDHGPYAEERKASYYLLLDKQTRSEGRN